MRLRLTFSYIQYELLSVTELLGDFLRFGDLRVGDVQFNNVRFGDRDLAGDRDLRILDLLRRRDFVIVESFDTVFKFFLHEFVVIIFFRFLLPVRNITPSKFEFIVIFEPKNNIDANTYNSHASHAYLYMKQKYKEQSFSFFAYKKYNPIKN